MTALVPNRFLFDFEFPLAYRSKLPRIDGTLQDWTEAERLPDLGDIDSADVFADVWACWNEQGLAIACGVTGKRRSLKCDPKKFWSGDNLRLCIDTRDARANKRATRYCHQFYFLPAGGGRGGKQASAGMSKIKRAREDAPTAPSGLIQVASTVCSSEYSMEAMIPAACLHGFDPVEHSRIGFYFILEDADFGQQFLTVGDDLYWYVDPSTWATAVLG